MIISNFIISRSFIKIASICFLCVIFLNSISLTGQEKILCKEVDSIKLFIETYYPTHFNSEKTYPAMVFFFGGGWVSGNRTQFLQQAKDLSQEGIICFLADYRIKSKHLSTPFESLKDAKSVMRFIRKNTSELSVNPNQIIGSGGSAGAQLAAVTALAEGYNEAGEDLAVSPKPNALVLFNPVIDNGPGGFGYNLIGEDYLFFSPLHNIKKGAPPTIIFLGTQDQYISIETIKYYATVMEKVNSLCVLKIYEGQNTGSSILITKNIFKKHWKRLYYF